MNFILELGKGCDVYRSKHVWVVRINSSLNHVLRSNRMSSEYIGLCFGAACTICKKDLNEML